MATPNLSWPDPTTFPADHPYRVLGLPPEDATPEDLIAWYERLVAVYAHMLDNANKHLGQLFLVVFEVPEAEQRYRQILRENRSLEANRATIRQHATRKDAVARLLRDAGLSG